MIITVDPTQSEDIAAFAMVKQYRLQALNVTLNGGTGSGAWQAVQGGEGYTQTVVTAVTGIELVYEDPNAIVSYTVENGDTSNYDAASDAGIILSSIEPTDNAWTYTCVFHADSVPVSSVDIDLLVYGNIARGTEQQGSPATAEEITAQVLAGLETRVTALEEEMPTKADVATTYTKTEIDNSVVKLTGNQTIAGIKTFTQGIIAYPEGWHICNANGQTQGQWSIFAKIHPTSIGAYHYIEFMENSNTAVAYGLLAIHENASALNPIWVSRTSKGGNTPIGNANSVTVLTDGTDIYLAWKKEPPYGGLMARSYLSTDYGNVRTLDTNITWYPYATMQKLDNLDGYTVVEPTDSNVRTTGAQTIDGVKTFTSEAIIRTTGQSRLEIQSTRTNPSQPIGGLMIRDYQGNPVSFFASRVNGATYLNLSGSTKAFILENQRAYDPNNPSTYANDVVTFGNLGSYPNFVRTDGNQTVRGLKSGHFRYKEFNAQIPQPSTDGKYRKMYTITSAPANLALRLIMQDTSNTSAAYMAYIMAVITSSSVVAGARMEAKTSNYLSTEVSVYFGLTADGTLDIWVKDVQYRPKQLTIDQATVYGTIQDLDITVDGNTTVADYTTYRTYTLTGAVQ